jgi:hypothetical protein
MGNAKSTSLLDNAIEFTDARLLGRPSPRRRRLMRWLASLERGW